METDADAIKTPNPNGWGKSPASPKWHYFNGSMSLCNRIGFFYGETEQGNDESPDNCATCKKKLAALKKKALAA